MLQAGVLSPLGKSGFDDKAAFWQRQQRHYRLVLLWQIFSRGTDQVPGPGLHTKCQGCIHSCCCSTSRLPGCCCCGGRGGDAMRLCVSCVWVAGWVGGSYGRLTL